LAPLPQGGLKSLKEVYKGGNPHSWEPNSPPKAIQIIIKARSCHPVDARTLMRAHYVHTRTLHNYSRREQSYLPLQILLPLQCMMVMGII
jgi:hypothetical protein